MIFNLLKLTGTPTLMRADLMSFLGQSVRAMVNQTLIVGAT